MTILNTISLESNKKIKINFNGGDLSSYGGLLLIKEFASRIGLIRLVKQLFKINDHTQCRIHKDPVMTAILDKEALASQPTLSRFWNCMDGDTLSQLDMIQSKMRDIVYSVQKPEHMLFDLDSMLLNTYGMQEGEGFNYHYQGHGYHPLFCYDGLTGDLLKAELRDSTQYCSKDADQFMIPLMQEYRSMQTACRYMFLPTTCSIGSGAWHYPQA